MAMAGTPAGLVGSAEWNAALQGPDQFRRKILDRPVREGEPGWRRAQRMRKSKLLLVYAAGIEPRTNWPCYSCKTFRDRREIAWDNAEEFEDAGSADHGDRSDLYVKTHKCMYCWVADDAEATEQTLVIPTTAPYTVDSLNLDDFFCHGDCGQFAHPVGGRTAFCTRCNKCIICFPAGQPGNPGPCSDGTQAHREQGFKIVSRFAVGDGGVSATHHRVGQVLPGLVSALGRPWATWVTVGGPPARGRRTRRTPGGVGANNHRLRRRMYTHILIGRQK